MKMDLRFVEDSLEDLWCDVAAALVFEEPYDLQGSIFSLDTRTGGYLSHLRKSGFFRGSLGSTILLASEGRAKADKIVLKGLGPRAECSPEAFVRCIGELGSSLVKLGVRDLAIWIPLLQILERDGPGFFSNACMTLLRPYEKRYGLNPEFYLKTVFSFPHELLEFMGDIMGSMRNAFGHLEDCSVIAVEKEQ